MKTSQNDNKLPAGYTALPGSERQAGATARLLGAAEASETLSVSIILRRRPDGPAMPDYNYYLKAPNKRKPLTQDEFADKYGAHPDDISKVVAFAEKAGLTVVSVHAASRRVVVSGTVAAMNKAFAISLGNYEHEVVVRNGEAPKKEKYRGREGAIHVPKDLVVIIKGIFGLDNRRINKRNSSMPGDPANTNTLTIGQVTGLYQFPSNSAAGQTIAIFSEQGYLPSDIATNFGGNPPAITNVSCNNANNNENLPPAYLLETTQDICIAAAAAPGAAIAVYFTSFDQTGWVDLLNTVIFPGAGQPVCSVLSSSYYILNADDANLLSEVSLNFVEAVDAMFQDAAVQGITMCMAAGDYGSYSLTNDGKPHVIYPASDPWVLAVGGTTIGNVNGNSFEEYIWNDVINTANGLTSVATGGGVSAFFNPVPTYQSQAGVPLSLNNYSFGRGVPDVAGNASPNSGYPIMVAGQQMVANGTSASAPLWGGLIAVLNAALGCNVGFCNPLIYQFGAAVFNPISFGPLDNGIDGTPGYPAGTNGASWYASTGWGSPNGEALLNAFAHTNAVSIEQTANPVSISSGQTVHNMYCDPRGHIIDIITGTNQITDYTMLTNAALAQGDPAPVFWGNDLFIFYVDMGGDISCIYQNDCGWQYQNLNGLLPGASLPGIGNAPHPTFTGYSLSPIMMGSELHLLYMDNQWYLCDIYYDGSNWAYQNLSSIIGGSIQANWPPAGGNPKPILYGGVLHVLYQAAMGHLSDMYYDGSSWQIADLSAQTYDMNITCDPSPVIFQNQLHVLCNVTTYLYDVYCDSGEWKCQYVPNSYEQVGILGSPSTAVYQDVYLQVIYRDIFGDVNDASFDATQPQQDWVLTALFSLVNNAAAYTAGSTAGSTLPASAVNDMEGAPFINVTGNMLQIIYTDINSSISMINYDGNTWSYQTLPTATETMSVRQEELV